MAKETKRWTRFCEKSARESKILRAKILRWHEPLDIIRSMWKPQIASLLDFDGLGIGQVLQVLYEQKRDPTQEIVIDGNPVPRVLRYTLEVYTEEVHKVELNVYYEPPGELLYVSWSRVGALTEDRRKVTVF